MENGNQSCRPHVMAFPFPSQGHLTAMMHFARKLAAQDILVTFVASQFQLKRMLQAAGEAESAAEIEGVRLVGLDDGLPDDTDVMDISVKCIPLVEGLGGQLERLLQDGGVSPPITCLVSDSFLPWTQPIASKWGIPRALFWAESLAVVSSYMCTSKLISAGYNPFLKRVKFRGERPSIGFIPGLPDMDPYDLPFNSDIDFPDEKDANKKWLESIVEFQFSSVKDVSWFIANTFEELEGPIAQALCSSNLIPPAKLLLLGPLCNGLPRHSHFRASLWKEDGGDDCLQWLDTQQEASVLYISFGSIIVRPASAIKDMAMALLACRQPFLWAQRSGWEDVKASLSVEFLEFAMKAGKFATWVPQLDVLSHRAIGGFFTHAGWNSTLESISKGVPMLAWPCFLDQFTNSWAISCVWKIGVQVMWQEGSDLVEELERTIRTLMQGPESHKFKERASQLATASLTCNHEHFSLFVEDILKRANNSTQRNN